MKGDGKGWHFSGESFKFPGLLSEELDPDSWSLLEGVAVDSYKSKLQSLKKHDHLPKNL